MKNWIVGFVVGAVVAMSMSAIKANARSASELLGLDDASGCQIHHDLRQISVDIEQIAAELMYRSNRP